MSIARDVKAVSVVQIGDTSSSRVGRFTLTLEDMGSTTFSCTVKVKDPEQALSALQAYPHRNRLSAGSTETTAAITSFGTYEILADGLDVHLDFTALSGDGVRVYARPLAG